MVDVKLFHTIISEPSTMIIRALQFVKIILSVLNSRMSVCFLLILKVCDAVGLDRWKARGAVSQNWAAATVTGPADFGVNHFLWSSSATCFSHRCFLVFV